MITKADVIQRLFAAALVLSAAHVSAYTNKTYMAPRPVGQNLALESATIDRLTHHRAPNAVGGTLEVTGFYTSSQDKEGLGSYFGPFNKNHFGISTQGDNGDIINTNIINPAGLNNNVAVTFAPTEETYGFIVHYHHQLHALSDKLFVAVNVPLVTVKHNINMRIDGDIADVDTLTQYFNGTLAEVNVGQATARKQLNKALIKGVSSVSKPGDIDVQLGYHFVKNEQTSLVAAAKLTIPAGNKADGSMLWESVSGNGGHAGLGIGGKLTSRVWGSHDKQVMLTLGADYTYLFESMEHLTVGIKNREFSQYYTTGLNGVAANLQQLVPAANILTLDVHVRPQGSFEGLASLTYKHRNCSATLGYNVFRRGEGKVRLADQAWKDNQYVYIVNGINAILMSSTDALTPTNFTQAMPLQKADLDLSSIQSVMMSQKVFGELAHTFNHDKNPVVIGAGAHYEFAGTNGTVENWGINVKAGISF